MCVNLPVKIIKNPNIRHGFHSVFHSMVNLSHPHTVIENRRCNNRLNIDRYNLKTFGKTF